MRTRLTFSLNFWINGCRAENEEAIIYARITVNGKRANISLKRKVPVESWDSSKGLVRGSKPFAKSLNKYLDQIRSLIYQSYEDLLNEGNLITASAIKNKFLGEDKRNNTLSELFEYHNSISVTSLSPHTIRHYKVTQRYLKKFLVDKYKTDDIYLTKLDYAFIKNFEFFLKSYVPKDHQKKMGHNTAMKHLQRLRKMLTMAYHHEWIDKDPFIRFKSSYIKNRREFLSQYELEQLEDFSSSLERLDIVKDIFLFACYTGLSYIDVAKLNIDNIETDLDGQQWIKTKRQKTSVELRIPLLNKARRILLKYQDHPRVSGRNRLLPTLSNQKTNSYLKEISDFCGIKKNLTFHVARHTFATTVTLTNGVPIETVSKLLGHTKLATTQIYARVVDHKVKQDMERLELKIDKGLRIVR
ncbi:site-specific integrase [Leeuwenhoekiella sp.]|jgi:site-specific recombinase XerD|nr:integrase [Leeuwenhoekiella sp.]MBQ53155.1 integrase [Leeuwenhoekiella sp.]HBT11155.1 integrase [Leeuwenhoekiella sp.]HCW65551.1 integrase [Leeuwenhoekiella sp.]|tara:strand:+ start:986 stop:2227 length:1242 start_codon:yes stop_codon:yes gene_type:complete